MSCFAKFYIYQMSMKLNQHQEASKSKQLKLPVQNRCEAKSPLSHFHHNLQFNFFTFTLCLNMCVAHDRKKSKNNCGMSLVFVSKLISQITFTIEKLLIIIVYINTNVIMFSKTRVTSIKI
jgi:hypothetical protein